jgi:oligosaccharyltransferase complex subunit beta
LVAVEGTNNARAVLCGSLDFFSDEFWNIKGSGNKAYI